MLGVMFYINWRFTLIGLSVAPVLFLVVYFYTKRIKKASRLVKKKESELLSGVAEVLTLDPGGAGVRARRLRGSAVRLGEPAERRRRAEGAQHQGAGSRRWSTSSSRSAPAWCSDTARVWSWPAELTTGELIVFLLYLGKTYKPMRDLSKMTNTVSKAAISFERIQELLEIESRVRRSAGRAAGAAVQRRRSNSITSASATTATRQILKDVSFRIEPGQVAAIVGPSGTGKTTIAGLIPRFFDPQSGRVTIDGTDIRQFTLKSLRDQVSFVLQDTLLFRGTIWENIAYGRPDAEIEDTVRAARAGQRPRVHRQHAA